jgi:hypothetical protein
LIEARGFKGRDENVLLPDFIVGSSPIGLTGLGDLCRELSVASASLRVVEGVLTDLAVLGRRSGV